MPPQHYIFIAIAVVLLLVLYSRMYGVSAVKSEDMDEVNMPDDDDAPARTIKNV